jgi:uncharacterized protein with HEPN domain
VSRDRLYLRHVLDAIERIARYVGVGYDEFIASDLRQDAVIRQVGIIGEAVRNLSPEVIASKPDIHWREIAAMRNVLIHDYAGVDLEAVWEVTQRDLPLLRRAVEDLLGER